MTLMRRETLECAVVTQYFNDQVAQHALAEGCRLAHSGALHVEVLGRGSSSHVGTMLRYALASHTSLSVAAALPSQIQRSVSNDLSTRTTLVAISQSGKSPDLIAYAQARRSAGVRVIGLINAAGSPLGQACDLEILLKAGEEFSVAATKSTVAAGLGALGLVAGYLQEKGDPALYQALNSLPHRMQAALGCDWGLMTQRLLDARTVFVVGRGSTFGVAKEVALKICEATGIPAVAYSSAEFLHGPLGAVSANTPVIGFDAEPQYGDSLAEAMCRARAMGAATLVAGGAGELPVPDAVESFTDALAMLPSAYLAIEAAARALGRNPDAPLGLAKVTETR